MLRRTSGATSRSIYSRKQPMQITIPVGLWTWPRNVCHRYLLCGNPMCVYLRSYRSENYCLQEQSVSLCIGLCQFTINVLYISSAFRYPLVITLFIAHFFFQSILSFMSFFFLFLYARRYVTYLQKRSCHFVRRVLLNEDYILRIYVHYIYENRQSFENRNVFHVVLRNIVC